MSVLLSGFSVSRPESAPTVATGTASGLLTPSAVYQYRVSFVTGFGETDLNASAASLTVGSTGSVNLTNIPVSANGNVIARRIYRTTGGGSTFLRLATLADNLTTTYTDLLADGSLGVAAPTSNTAHSVQNVNGWLRQNFPPLRSTETGITAGAGGTQTGAYQLTAEYNWISTVATTNDSVRLPALNSALIGLHLRIRNNGANTARIFPFSGQTIDGGSVDAAITLAAGAGVTLVSDTASNWRQN